LLKINELRDRLPGHFLRVIGSVTVSAFLIKTSIDINQSKNLFTMLLPILLQGQRNDLAKALALLLSPLE
jgi:hypothetical protein